MRYYSTSCNFFQLIWLEVHFQQLHGYAALCLFVSMSCMFPKLRSLIQRNHENAQAADVTTYNIFCGSRWMGAMTSVSCYFVWVVTWQVICKDITNTLILLFEVQAYQLEWNHAEEQTHFTRTAKTFFEMKLSLMKSAALASVSKWLTYSSPAVSVVSWGKLSTKHLIPMSIRASLLPKRLSFLWLYNLPASKYDY